MKITILSIVLLLLITACHTNPDQKDGQSQELPGLSYTVYSGSTELFAEFETPVVGDTISLAGHFTYLGENFTALTKGSVTMTLQVGENSVSQTASVSSSAGIFRFAVVPVVAGIGRMVFDIKNEDYTDRVIIDSVTVYQDHKTALSQASNEHSHNEITYLKEQAWKIEFANMEVKARPFNEVIKTSGEILPARGDEMDVVATSNGIIVISDKAGVAGTSLNRGDIMFTISANDFVDGNPETRFVQARSSFEKAKADYEKAQELTADNIISQKDFREIKARYESEKATFNNISRNYQAGGQKIVSPITGFIKNVLVRDGQYVTAGQPLATVTQNRKLVLRADVSQRHYTKLPAIASATFRTLYDNKVYDLKSLNGNLLSYGKSNDQSTMFVPVTFSFDNKEGIISGTVVEVYLKLKSAENSIVIPITSLIEEHGNYYAYVQTGGESFEKRAVVTGGSDGLNVQILSGINEGDRVVTKGAYQIKLATATGTIPDHGHAH